MVGDSLLQYVRSQSESSATRRSGRHQNRVFLPAPAAGQAGAGPHLHPRPHLSSSSWRPCSQTSDSSQAAVSHSWSVLRLWVWCRNTGPGWTSPARWLHLIRGKRAGLGNTCSWTASFWTPAAWSESLSQSWSWGRCSGSWGPARCSCGGSSWGDWSLAEWPPASTSERWSCTATGSCWGSAGSRLLQTAACRLCRPRLSGPWAWTGRTWGDRKRERVHRSHLWCFDPRQRRPVAPSPQINDARLLI